MDSGWWSVMLLSILERAGLAKACALMMSIPLQGYCTHTFITSVVAGAAAGAAAAAAEAMVVGRRVAAMARGPTERAAVATTRCRDGLAAALRL